MPSNPKGNTAHTIRLGLVLAEKLGAAFVT